MEKKSSNPEIRIVIEMSSDHYSAYAENVEGIYGAGNSVEEAKKSVLDAIELLKKHNSAEKLPKILTGNYGVAYHMDVPSVLNYYKGIFTLSALERLTGINQKQLQHYATGLKNPRQAQSHKIEEAFHRLGSELLAIQL
jgi:predicted RNase H-like HicB family nuclease